MEVNESFEDMIVWLWCVVEVCHVHEWCTLLQRHANTTHLSLPPIMRRIPRLKRIQALRRMTPTVRSCSRFRETVPWSPVAHSKQLQDHSIIQDTLVNSNSSSEGFNWPRQTRLLTLGSLSPFVP